MKRTNRFLFLPLILAAPLAAEQLTVAFSGFAQPQGFNIVEGATLDLRVIEQVPAPGGTNASTHVLIEGLSPVEEGSLTYASPYRGINSTSGEEQDLGVLYLNLPEGAALPEGTVSSPIVGVVQRSGSWPSPFTPETALGGAAGSSDIAENTIEASVIKGGTTFTGSIPYTVIDTDTIELDPFTLSSGPGGETLNLSGATLVRDGLRFYGTVTNLGDGAAYDALFYSMEFRDIADADSDGIPDLTDDAVAPGGLLVDQWQDLGFSWVYGLTPEWGLSSYMEYIFVPFAPPYIYQSNLEWLYLFSSNGEEHILYDWELGWILTNEGFGGFYYVYDTDSWHVFSDPQP